MAQTQAPHFAEAFAPPGRVLSPGVGHRPTVALPGAAAVDRQRPDNQGKRWRVLAYDGHRGGLEQARRIAGSHA